jgi:hypothetical protein
METLLGCALLKRDYRTAWAKLMADVQHFDDAWYVLNCI